MSRLPLSAAFLAAGFVAVLLASAARAAPLVDAAAQVPGLVVEMRYAGSHNFMRRPAPGYEAPRCMLLTSAAKALAAAQVALAADGFGLKVFDCYRPKRAVAAFVAWASEPDDPAAKAEFYPDLAKRDLFRLGYIARSSGHSRGTTVDLTLVDKASGRELDMGSPYDLFGERSHYAHPKIAPEARANRARLRAAMERAGFAPYAKEWWHFSARGAGPALDVPVK